MKKIVFPLLCLAALTGWGQELHKTDLARQVLAAAGASNPELLAADRLTEARKLGAREGNNLQDPTVTYDRLWGRDGAANLGEVNVVQGFDFPTAYGARSRQARTLGAQYDAEYGVAWQETMLAALQTLIEVDHLLARGELLYEREQNARRLEQTYARRFAAGDASKPDWQRAGVELANARTDLQSNAIDLEAAAARLDLICGGQAPRVRAAGGLGPLPALPTLDEAEDLWEQDPRLAVARTSADAARGQVSVARGEALPKFELGYRGERAGGERLDGVKVGMSVPLFQSRHTVSRAKAEQAAAQEILTGTERRKAIEVQRLHARAAMLREACAESAAAMEGAGSLDLPRRALDAGQITLEEYLSKAAAANLLRERQLTLERDYRLSVAELLKPVL